MARPDDSSWKNQRRNIVGRNHPVAFRMSNDMHKSLSKLAEKNNTTVAAIVRYSVEQFLEQQAPKAAPAKQSLFG